MDTVRKEAVALKNSAQAAEAAVVISSLLAGYPTHDEARSVARAWVLRWQLSNALPANDNGSDHAGAEVSR